MDDESRLLWKTISRKPLYKGPIFDIHGVRRESSDGRSGLFIEVDAPMWATVIPWFRNAAGTPCFFMVRQYRHGSDSVTIEFPAGLVEQGEDPKVAALRELLEETGCIPDGEVVELGCVSPNSAFMNNRVSFFFVEGVRKTSGQSLDIHEQIDILIVPVREVLDSMGTGVFDNGIMMIAQAFFLRYSKNRPELIS
jgi:ADP-ribose pyrophosphatase